MTAATPAASAAASAHAPPQAGRAETRLPVRRAGVERVRFLAQAMQDLPAVLTVLVAGASAARSGREGGALAAAELLVGAWVLVTILREARHVFRRAAHAHAAGHGMPDHDTPNRAAPNDWPPNDGAPGAAPGSGSWRSSVEPAGLAAAALGYVEVWRHTVERGHFKLVSPYMLGATVTLLFALGGRRLIRRRLRRRGPHLLVTPSAVTYRGTRFHRWTAAWDDVAAVEHGPDALVLHRRDGGRHAIHAAEHLDGHALVASAAAAVAAHAPARLRPGPAESVLVSPP